jgi:uncharacterized protein YdeI (YjbR/CyaY-like superfamily)
MTEVRTPGPMVRAADANAWRGWLERHHADRREVWLVISKKHASKPSPTLREAMNEALCFGWIDSVLRPIDDERYALRFTPRRKGSRWSKRNREWAEKLIEEGQMTEAGLERIREAQRSGRWA